MMIIILWQNKALYPHSKSVYRKAPIPAYFDGKIDVKDNIQKGDSLGYYEKKRIGKRSYSSVF